MDYDWEFQSPTARGALVLRGEAEGKLRYRDAEIERLRGALVVAADDAGSGDEEENRRIVDAWLHTAAEGANDD